MADLEKPPSSQWQDGESSLLLKKSTNDDEVEEHSRWNLLTRLVPHGGLLASGLNIASATLGAGTLSIPSAVQGCGLILGSIILVVIAALTLFSIVLLARLYDQTGFKTYEEMSRNYGGKNLEKFTTFIIVIFCWGMTVVYVTAMCDILTQVATLSWFPKVFADTDGSHLLVIAFWAVFFLPLSLLKEINSLRWTSTLGNVSTCYLVLVILVHCANSTQTGEHKIKWAVMDVSTFAALPDIIFAYSCQTNAFEIYTELKPRTVRRMTLATGISLTICTVIYIAAGVAGAVTYGSGTRGNILKNWTPDQAVYIAIAFLGVSLVMVSSFPIVIFPTRDTIVQVMGYASAYYTPSVVRIVLCATLAYFSLLFGLYAPGIKLLFGLLGGVCGSSLGFILPAVFTLKSEGYSRKAAGNIEYFSVWFLLVFGFISGILGTTMSIVEVVQNPPH